MRTLPKLVGNPIFAWAKMELESLGLDAAKYLRGEGENVSLADWTPSRLFKAMNVETVCPCVGARDASRLSTGGTSFRGTGFPTRVASVPALGRGTGFPTRAENENAVSSTNCEAGPQSPHAEETLSLLHEFPEAMATPSAHFSPTLREGAFHRRNLPHVAHDSSLVFVTFRLADSLPRELLDKFACDYKAWLSHAPDGRTSEEEQEYSRSEFRRLNEYLDEGHGSCLFKDPHLRKVVESSLEFFNENGDGQGRYVLHSYVVMPNHVHVLFELKDAADLPKVLKSWKGYSAREVNRLCNKTGVVWQDEYFDRLVRDADHYQRVVEYVRQNAAIGERLAGHVGGGHGLENPCPEVEAPSRVGKPVPQEDDARVGKPVPQEDDARVGKPVPRVGVLPSLRMNAGDVVTDEQLAAFAAAGCRVVDISVDDDDDLERQSDSLAKVAGFAAARGWTMLLHLGALRETSARLRRVAGPAGGYAGMRAPVDPEKVARFLDRLETSRVHVDGARVFQPVQQEEVPSDGARVFQPVQQKEVSATGAVLGSSVQAEKGPSCGSTGWKTRAPNSTGQETRAPDGVSTALPRTILLSLNPEAHAQLAVLAGSFNEAGMPGKVQLGPAWWWCDHEEGIRDVLEKNAAYGVLSTFIGMTTDSRSLLSFVRHDYFRRILCKWMADKIEAGAFPEDEALIRPLLEKVCYWNAKVMIGGEGSTGWKTRAPMQDSSEREGS